MNRLVIVLILNLFALTSFSQGIEFFHGSLEEAFNKANKESKQVFVDIYTSWCGPCKKLALQVFPQKELGTYFNNNFVSVKIDAEKGQGPEIAKKYVVNGYPTLLFLKANGDKIKSIAGFISANDLLKTATGVRKGGKSIEELELAFKNGTSDLSVLQEYCNELKLAFKFEKRDEVFAKYLKLSIEKNKITADLFNDFFQVCIDSRKEIFNTFISSKEAFKKVVGKEKFEKKLREFYINELYYNYFGNEQEFAEGKKYLATKIELSEEERLILDMDFYFKHENEEKFISTGSLFIEKYANSSKFSLGYYVLAPKFVSKEKLSILEKWGKKILPINNDALNNSFMATIYYAMGNDKLAKEYIDITSKIVDKGQDPYCAEASLVIKAYEEKKFGF